MGRESQQRRRVDQGQGQELVYLDCRPLALPLGGSSGKPLGLFSVPQLPSWSSRVRHTCPATSQDSRKSRSWAFLFSPSPEMGFLDLHRVEELFYGHSQDLKMRKFLLKFELLEIKKLGSPQPTFLHGNSWPSLRSSRLVNGACPFWFARVCPCSRSPICRLPLYTSLCLHCLPALDSLSGPCRYLSLCPLSQEDTPDLEL